MNPTWEVVPRARARDPSPNSKASQELRSRAQRHATARGRHATFGHEDGGQRLAHGATP